MSVHTWASFVGLLPKLKVVCGRCNLYSKTRAQRSADRNVFVWCPHCGVANVARGLIAA